MAQGTLFSFFKRKDPSSPQPKNNSNKTSKKKSSPSSSSSTTPSSKKSSSKLTPNSKSNKTLASSSSRSNKTKKNPAFDVCVGYRISVLWPDDEEYYDAQVTAKIDDGTTFSLLYEDGETENIDLSTEKFKILSKTSSGSQSPTQPVDNKRKRRVIEEEEDEDDEMSVDKDDDGSVFSGANASENEDDEEIEDTWMVSEDDEDNDTEVEIIEKPKKNNKRMKVTVLKPKTPHVVACTSSDSSTVNNATEAPKLFTPPRTEDSMSQSFSSFACTKVSTKTDNKTNSSKKVNKVTPSMNRAAPPVSNNNTLMVEKNSSNTTTSLSHDPPMWQDGVANPAGSHVHNHLKFLHPPRDAKGHRIDDPSYNPRTLRVDYRELERKYGKKISPAQEQWWSIKAEYFDTVLLFKTGKFYEMFHMDADVGVKELGFIYMKGKEAHAGCPEAAYGTISEKLVAKGYKVARVEQTETPEMMKERKKKTVGKKPKVVNREVCSILTKGTRTFCFMDNTHYLDKSKGGGGNQHAGTGPLLSIREVVKADGMVEYGVALTDAIRSTVTLGQFADDVLRSRMLTLLSSFEPCEILIHNNISAPLKSMLASQNVPLEIVQEEESFPKSTAVDPQIRKKLERPHSVIKPWDSNETITEMHRRAYFPRSSRKKNHHQSVKRWPAVLKACVEGDASLAIGALGASLFYLQRNLIDEEILTMGDFKAYIPPSSPTIQNDYEEGNNNSAQPQVLERMCAQEQIKQSGIIVLAKDADTNMECENKTDHLQLDGTTLSNLEILTNQFDGTQKGSLWSKLNQTKTPHGSRLLKAWLLRPLFQKSDIDHRSDAVQELVEGGSASLALREARSFLGSCGDMERLLGRVHSMGMNAGNSNNNNNNDDDEDDTDEPSSFHPNDRAILYEGPKYTKRKVEDFSKLLSGLKSAGQAVNCFEDVDLVSPLLQKIVKRDKENGCFPSSLESELQWFFDNFDCSKAMKGEFEPARGVDPRYDEACDGVAQLLQDLEDYKDDMCNNSLGSKARSAWKYINVKPDSKDKYLIELPVHVKVPSDFYVKGKRGKGAKQVNKYRTPVVEDIVTALEQALKQKTEGKARGMQMIFAKFDSYKPLWSAAIQATAMLDALGAISVFSTTPGFSRAEILDCGSTSNPTIEVEQGRHPCVEMTHSGGDFVPNDLTLGGESGERLLLLSGPNMGGKSTLLRQTCQISILAQIGSFVPARKCALTPIDRIFTRLGASDRILSGQSTFFVELAETAAALRGASRRSLVIMDELGRGTSTFDGTAIAHATVKHLVENNQCLSMFATHYHSLLEDWKNEKCVRLGHMECVVEDDDDDDDDDDEENDDEQDGNAVDKSDSAVAFLYTLGEGACPKSFGINVAKLASLPQEVLAVAKQMSSDFENEMNGNETEEESIRLKVKEALDRGDLETVESLWESLVSSS